jgi:hypothetical protein
MTSNDDDPRLSDADARFVEQLGAAYRAPEPTAADRVRFAARLEQRLARRGRRRAWWLASASLGAAALLFALLPASAPAPRESVTASEAARPSTEEALLLLANGPLDDPNEALPADYQTLASLLE